MNKFVSEKPDLTFDDVLINPERSSISSRFDNKQCFPYVKHGSDYFLPIVSSPMDSIPSEKFIQAASNRLMTIFTCRFLPFEKQLEQISMAPGRVGGVIGVNTTPEEIRAICEAGATDVVLDVANGGNDNIISVLKNIELQDRRSSNFRVWAGNVANAEGYRMLAEYCDFVRVGIGSGCFGAGTRVLMADGTYKNIEEINVNDEVINKDGNPVRVIGVKWSGKKKVLKHRHVKFYKPTYATPDHLHWGFKFDNRKIDVSDYGYKAVSERSDTWQGWFSLEEMKEGGIFTCPSNINFKLRETFSINLSDYGKSRAYKPVAPSYDLGFVFGAFLGDGNSNYKKTEKTTYGKVTFNFGKEQEDEILKLKYCIENSLSIEAKVKELPNMWRIEVDNLPLAKLFKHFGKKTEKHLPSEYLVKDTDYLNGLYDGLKASDGNHTDNDREGFYNTSERLIELHMVLCKILKGSFPNSRSDKVSIGNLKGANIENFNTPIRNRLNLSEHKRITKEHQLIKTLNIEDTSIIIDTYDIEVDCDTHSFIANNVAVHNSACTTRINTGCGRGLVTSLLECRQAYEELSRMNPNKKYAKLVADGGLKYNGDFGKAYVAGAHIVMTGRLFAQTYESAAPFCYKVADEIHFLPNDFDPLNQDGPIFKSYRGMASRAVNEEAGRDMTRVSVEGASGLVKASGPVNVILDEIESNLRSTISYVGVSSVSDLYTKGKFAIVSPSVTIENRAHGFD